MLLPLKPAIQQHGREADAIALNLIRMLDKLAKKNIIPKQGHRTVNHRAKHVNSLKQ